MISIHGKINETQVESSEEVQILFTLNDNSLHKYLYKDNKIFFHPIITIFTPKIQFSSHFALFCHINLLKKLKMRFFAVAFINH